MKKSILFVLILAAVLLAGCGKAPEVDIPATQTFEAALQTAVMSTVQAENEAAEADSTPESTEPTAEVETQPEPTPTFTTVPLTPEPTQSPAQPTTGPTAEPSTPCYRAELISETIPDGTIFTPGTMFTKIWVIRNTGVCEWTKDFKWKLVEGEDFNAPTELKLLRSVMPGEELEVKIEMKTPLLEGNYQGTYQILTEEGASVTPLGFWVYIISRK